MSRKIIILSGGPLDGQQVEVHEYSNCYTVVTLESIHTVLDNTNCPNEPIPIKEKHYHKSDSKVGNNEIFVWQD